MSKNELIIRTPMLPAKNTESVGPDPTVFVNYDKVGDTDYRFSSKIDDDISVDMSKDRSGKYAQNDADDVIDVEYEEHIPENELLYYGIAMASGLLTGMLSNHVSAQVIDEAKKVVSDDKKDLKAIRSLIVTAAKFCGCKDKDFKKAVRYLFVNKSINVIRHMPVELENAEFGELSGQPTVAGLVFSILTQYSSVYYYLDKGGEIKTRKVPKGYVVGEDDDEKIALAVMYWFFYVCAGYVTMGKKAFEELELPDKLTELVTKICQGMIDNKKIPKSYKEAEQQFDKWLAEMKNLSRAADPNRDILSIMKTKMGSISKQLFPVLLNEGLVRASYTLCRLAYEIKNKDIMSLEDIFAIDLKEIVPYGNRIISNMCLIASGTFVAANISPAVSKAVTKIKNKDIVGAVEDIITVVNIAGIGRVVIAFADNSKYFNENVHVLFNNLKWSKFKFWGTGQTIEPNMGDSFRYEKDMEDILNLMMLDSAQTRMLYSIENLMLGYDILHTKKPADRSAKKEWHAEWQSRIGALVNEEPVTYFIRDESLLYDELYGFSRDTSNHRWIYVLTMELCIFKPYSPLGSENDKAYKGLKTDADYLKDQYVRRQTVATQDDTERIRKYFKHYKGAIDGSTKNLVIGAGSAGAVAVAAGAAAFTFAPGIAVAIMGKTFVGLHGAALTNASLAALGGGSLAAGGFGMAGGTAVIAGGGALVGFTGTGAVAAAASMLMMSKEDWIILYAKLLMFVKFILKEKLGETDKVIKIKHCVSYISEVAEEQLKQMKAEKTPLDKEQIELTENYVKYLRKLDAEMRKI